MTIEHDLYEISISNTIDNWQFKSPKKHFVCTYIHDTNVLNDSRRFFTSKTFPSRRVSSNGKFLLSSCSPKSLHSVTRVRTPAGSPEISSS